MTYVQQASIKACLSNYIPQNTVVCNYLSIPLILFNFFSAEKAFNIWQPTHYNQFKVVNGTAPKPFVREIKNYSFVC